MSIVFSETTGVYTGEHENIARFFGIEAEVIKIGNQYCFEPVRPVMIDIKNGRRTIKGIDRPYRLNHDSDIMQTGMEDWSIEFEDTLDEAYPITNKKSIRPGIFDKDDMQKAAKIAGFK